MRFATENDLPRILEIYSPYVKNTTWSFEYTVPEPDEFRRRFETVTSRFPWLVWEQDGAVQGYAYASAPFERAGFAWCSEVSVYIAPEYHGQGIGKKLYKALESILKLQGYRIVYAVITDENAASIRFHQAAGYEEIARLPGCGVKFGKILGVVYMQKVLNSVETPRTAPVPWYKIVNYDVNTGRILDTIPI